MNWKIDNAPLPSKPVSYKPGDLVIYKPTGNVYLLGKKKDRHNLPPLFSYICWSASSSSTTITGDEGNFDSKDFSLFTGSITLSN